MRLIIIFLLIFALYSLNATEKLARLHYAGGGDWYNDPDILPNIVQYINKTLQTDFSKDQDVVKPSESKIYDYPFIFMTGHGNITFSEKETVNIRRYMLQGGFLYVDDDYGMDESFRKAVKKIFPEKNLIELPVEHEIFNSYFHFPQGLPKIHKHDDKRPQAFAIFDDDGRMMMLYTSESNISDGWTNAHNDPAEIREKAFKFGANLFYYILTR